MSTEIRQLGGGYIEVASKVDRSPDRSMYLDAWGVATILAYEDSCFCTTMGGGAYNLRHTRDDLLTALIVARKGAPE